MPGAGKITGSFRDPSGFLFWKDGRLYRQVNAPYQEHFEHLMKSGLYQELIDQRLLIPHIEIDLDYAISDDAFCVVQPELIPFVSYPYEWCFSQLKDAALATLAIQKRALDFDMTLKDASAYNIQFLSGKSVLIDTLSFEKYREGQPWVAYRQFCQHFLAPLALMSCRDVRLGQLPRVHIDGVPLDLAASLLPGRTRFRPGLLAHIHAHARAQQAYAGREVDTGRARSMTRHQLLGLIQTLEATVRKLNWEPRDTEWADYYEGNSYGAAGMQHKQELVEEYIKQAAPGSLWDLGANTGLFSRISSAQGIPTVAWDVDPGAVEINFRQIVKDREDKILPLVLDLTNPSPAIGWAHQERDSLLQRGPVDAVLALALVHHLAIANNLAFDQIVAFFASLCTWLIIEFVPKTDPKVQKLLATREDIFPHYTQPHFESAYRREFTIKRCEKIRHSERVLYLMKRK
jgi:ribosomal protein L11 methylase PrmA